MRSRHSLGSTVRIYFDLIDAGAGLISQSPTIAIRRVSDGDWFQVSDGTWQTTIVQNDMIQLSTAFLPGRYYLDFDQSLDDVADSTEYIVRKTNLGDNPATEYDDLVFGPLAASSSVELCSVQGTVVTAQGQPMHNVLVRATLIPTLSLGLGRVVQSERILATYTGGTGAFDLPLVRGGIFRLEITAVGYDRKVTIPDQSSVLFTEL